MRKHHQYTKRFGVDGDLFQIVEVPLRLTVKAFGFCRRCLDTIFRASSGPDRNRTSDRDRR